jgi:alcohol dehydrogenase class IV
VASRFEELRDAAGLPRRLRDAGIPHHALPELAEEASRQWTLGFNPRPALRDDLVRLYEAAY